MPWPAWRTIAEDGWRQRRRTRERPDARVGGCPPETIRFLGGLRSTAWLGPAACGVDSVELDTPLIPQKSRWVQVCRPVWGAIARLMTLPLPVSRMWPRSAADQARAAAGRPIRRSFATPRLLEGRITCWLLTRCQPFSALKESAAASAVRDNAPSADRIVCRGRAGEGVAPPRGSVSDGRQPTERDIEAAAGGGPATSQGGVWIRIASSRSRRRSRPAHGLFLPVWPGGPCVGWPTRRCCQVGTPPVGAIRPDFGGTSAAAAEGWTAATPSEAPDASGGWCYLVALGQLPAVPAAGAPPAAHTTGLPRPGFGLFSIGQERLAQEATLASSRERSCRGRPHPPGGQ
jgi:hypothetical protein